MQIQQHCYPADLLESIDAFANKLTLTPRSNWLAELDGIIVGYFFTHPWVNAEPPQLNRAIEQLPHPAEIHFWHDLAVLPRARGSGAAATLIRHALQWGAQQGLYDTKLVAVQSAASFWQHWNFVPEQIIEGYDDQAVLMRRTGRT